MEGICVTILMSTGIVLENTGIVIGGVKVMKPKMAVMPFLAQEKAMVLP